VDLLHQWQKIVMYQHQIIFGVVHGVENLLRRQTDIHRVQHRAKHGHGEKTLQIPMAVPIQQGHGITGLDARLRERVGQSLDALIQCPVAVAQLVRVDNFLIGVRPRATGS
jgi:hypothetical protein